MKESELKNSKECGKELEFVAFCTTGLEGAVAIELKKFNYKITYSSSGRIFFKASLEDIPFLNVIIKSADRINILIREFEASTFDELYENVYNSNIKSIVEKNGKIKIEKVKTTNSKLSATGAVASVVKKALIDSLGGSNESGSEYPFVVIIKDNKVYLLLDTTGKDGLHKRGYRIKTSKAPLRETIAAGILILSRWDSWASYKNREKNFKLFDPFCGSGTIPIEAATLEIPNLSRSYISQKWKILSSHWEKIHIQLLEKILNKTKTGENIIFGSDIDSNNIKIAVENLNRAVRIFNANYLKNTVHFKCIDFKKLPVITEECYVVSNLPYGERLDDNVLRDITILKEKFPNGKFYLLHPSEKFEAYFGKATKKFRFQNSGIWTYLYMYY
ncbi:MAG: class I SAM-dependent RNA methyltransferase [Fervidobacterium sp.]